MVSSGIGRGPVITDEEGEGSRHWLLNLEKPSINGYVQDFPANDHGAFDPSQLQQIADHERRGENSTSVPPSKSQTFKKWLTSDPLNTALFLWLTCVTVLGLISFCISKHYLDSILKGQSDVWHDTINQIICALVTLFCLYHQPTNFYDLVLLCSWKQGARYLLRQKYCKNGTLKPHERAHMVVLVILANLGSFSQYGVFYITCRYPSSKRPTHPLIILIAIGVTSALVGGLYRTFSPLGKDYDSQGVNDEDRGRTSQFKEKGFYFVSRNDHREVEGRPQWRGGLFDLNEDVSKAVASFFCVFCVFGWNMERLRFGSTYVQTATFLMFCFAPFFIFNLASISIDSDAARQAMGIIAVLLSVFGLLYGGYWRIQMRKRFKLRGNDLCFGKPDVVNCLQWLCCPCCSLAQEVRTADAYDIVEKEENFRRFEVNANGHPPLSPLPLEGGGVGTLRSNPSSPVRENEGPYTLKIEDFHSYGLESHVMGRSMMPPISSRIQRRDD